VQILLDQVLGHRCDRDSVTYEIVEELVCIGAVIADHHRTVLAVGQRGSELDEQFVF
jgi:hypothetical protein